MSEPRILLSHPGVGEFVEQVGLTFLERGWLTQFNTSIHYNPDSFLQRMCIGLGKCVGADLDSQFRRRDVINIPKEMINAWPHFEFLRLVVARLDRSGKMLDWVWEIGEKKFSRWSARHGLSNANAVYAYEHGALDVFRAAKAQGAFRIYDLPSPENDYVYSIINAELEKFPSLMTPYRKQLLKHHERRQVRKREEFELASICIANSSFTRESFAKAGLNVDKVKVVPLAAPAVDPAGIDGGSVGEGPVRFLWAGSLSVRKGGHYMIDAWRKLNPNKSKAILHVYGANDLPDSMFKDLPESVQLQPTVPHHHLMDLYKEYDALVFPTLCDGFGLVTTEALSRGLPVIITKRAGSSDLIQDGKNGYILEPGNIDQLQEILNNCISNRSKLKEMREQALQTARNWQWDDYRQLLASTVGALYESSGRNKVERIGAGAH